MGDLHSLENGFLEEIEMNNKIYKCSRTSRAQAYL